jgi:hypothetical protein
MKRPAAWLWRIRAPGASFGRNGLPLRPNAKKQHVAKQHAAVFGGIVS